MSLLDISATLDQYIIENYSNPLNVDLPDFAFDDTNKDTWIRPRYNPIDRKAIGTDKRIEDVGLLSVKCFAKYRKTSLMVADEIATLLDEVQIGNISLRVGVPNIPINLDNGLWYCEINFKVVNY